MADTGMTRTAPQVTRFELGLALVNLELEERIQRLKNQGIKVVVLDMRLCVRINTPGFQSLLTSHQLLSGPGEQLRLFGITKSLEEKIARYNPTRVFHIFETEDEAMKDLPANDE